MDEFASAIALVFPHIHVLYLAFVEGITDKGLEIILKQCSSLRHLGVFGMEDINGSSFICIPQYAHKLISLVIEKICDTKKEEHLNELLKLDPKLYVLRSNIRKNETLCVACFSNRCHHNNTNGRYMYSK